MYRIHLTRKTAALAALSTVAIITTVKTQSICESDDQCDVDYYCNELLNTCNKCVTCENFKEGDSCAKVISDCVSRPDCLDGFRDTKDGSCVPYSITPKVVATAVSITVTLGILATVSAVYVFRRKRYALYINPENGIKTIPLQPLQPVLPTAPAPEAEYLVGPPSYNDHYFEGAYRPIACSETLPMISNPDVTGHAFTRQQESMQTATLSNPPRYDAVLPSVSVNPPTDEVQEEEPPPPEDIPQHRNTETQDSNDNGHNETTPQQSSPVQVYVTINNTNTVHTF